MVRTWVNPWTYCHNPDCEACYPRTGVQQRTGGLRDEAEASRQALADLLNAARRIDDELRRAWDARILPADAVSGEAIVLGAERSKFPSIQPLHEDTTMGREVRRVALDWRWPLGKVWDGFLNPLYTAGKCEKCSGSGHSPEAKHLHDLWYGYAYFLPQDRGSVPFRPTEDVIRTLAERNVSHSPEYYGPGEQAVFREAVRLCTLFNGQWCHHLNQQDVDALVDANRLMDFTHTWTKGEGWQPKEPAYRPTAIEVNRWSLSSFGHDSINCHVVINAECERIGAPSQCHVCNGSGEIWPSEEAEQAYEAWEETDPPAGEGWQLWETVSEGSPVSPVFATAEELVQWLTTEEGYHEDAARRFVDVGWAPSLVIDSDRGVMDGIAAS